MARKRYEPLTDAQTKAIQKAQDIAPDMRPSWWGPRTTRTRIYFNCGNGNKCFISFGSSTNCTEPTLNIRTDWTPDGSNKEFEQIIARHVMPAFIGVVALVDEDAAKKIKEETDNATDFTPFYKS